MTRDLNLASDVHRRAAVSMVESVISALARRHGVAVRDRDVRLDVRAAAEEITYSLQEYFVPMLTATYPDNKVKDEVRKAAETMLRLPIEVLRRPIDYLILPNEDPNDGRKYKLGEEITLPNGAKVVCTGFGGAGTLAMFAKINPLTGVPEIKPLSTGLATPAPPEAGDSFGKHFAYAEAAHGKPLSTGLATPATPKAGDYRKRFVVVNEAEEKYGSTWSTPTKSIKENLLEAARRINASTSGVVQTKDIPDAVIDGVAEEMRGKLESIIDNGSVWTASEVKVEIDESVLGPTGPQGRICDGTASPGPPTRHCADEVVLAAGDHCSFTNREGCGVVVVETVDGDEVSVRWTKPSGLVVREKVPASDLVRN